MHLKEVLYNLQNLLKQSTTPQAGGWERDGRAHEPQLLPVVESHNRAAGKNGRISNSSV